MIVIWLFFFVKVFVWVWLCVCYMGVLIISFVIYYGKVEVMFGSIVFCYVVVCIGVMYYICGRVVMKNLSNMFSCFVCIVINNYYIWVLVKVYFYIVVMVKVYLGSVICCV